MSLDSIKTIETGTNHNDAATKLDKLQCFLVVILITRSDKIIARHFWSVVDCVEIYAPHHERVIVTTTWVAAHQLLNQDVGSGIYIELRHLVTAAFVFLFVQLAHKSSSVMVRSSFLFTKSCYQNLWSNRIKYDQCLQGGKNDCFESLSS